jgi:hypothetical protein
VLNGKVELSLPKSVIHEQSRRYMKGNKPIHRPEMENDSVFTIISYYQRVYRGIVEYYRMVHNVSLLNKLKWIMETSCAPCRCVIECLHDAGKVESNMTFRTTAYLAAKA